MDCAAMGLMISGLLAAQTRQTAFPGLKNFARLTHQEGEHILH